MNYKIAAVDGYRDWADGDVRYWNLRLEGVDKPVSLGYKPITKPGPTVGEELNLELTPDARFPEKLKAKRAGNFGGNAGGGPRPTDPKAVAGMQRSHSQEMALMYVQAKVACGALQTFEWDDVMKLADAFLKDVQKAVAAS